MEQNRIETTKKNRNHHQKALKAYVSVLVWLIFLPQYWCIGISAEELCRSITNCH